ncbi:MAG: virginiamycin lyase, partial [Solirubrobacteraceae bacterium]|nr:virginiamycin lyase [Solirubrobacteraceae bacterium]
MHGRTVSEGIENRRPSGGTIYRIIRTKLKSLTWATLVVGLAMGLAVDQSFARGPAERVPSARGTSLLAVAAAPASATRAQGFAGTQLEVTVHNKGRKPLPVSASDFIASAQGDIFAAQAWNGGHRAVDLRPGQSRAFRVSFALPSAARKEATLSFRPGASGVTARVPLNRPTHPKQRSPSRSKTRSNLNTPFAEPLADWFSATTASSRQPLAMTASVAASSPSEPTINTFSAGGGVGEPWGTAIDGAGNVWFAEPGCDFAPTCSSNTAPGQIGEFKASTHTMVFYLLPNISGNQPIFLAFDGSGNLWFTTPDNSMIGEFNPSTGQFVGQWPVTSGSGPWDLTFAGGKLWYTEHLVSAIGSFNPSTHAHEDFQTPTANSNPYGIAANGGLIWFTENNSSVDRIAALDTTHNNTISEYPITLPTSNSTPHLVAIDSRGNPWWTEGWSNTIATLNTAAATPGQCGVTSGTCNGIQRFAAPPPTTCTGSGTHASGIAIQASSGTVWFDNSLTAQVGSFSPLTDTFAMTSLSNCGAHPHDGLNLDGGGNVWFDEEFANALGELVPPPPPTPSRLLTFGKTVVGGTSDSFVANRKRVHRYTLSTTGFVTNVSIYLAPTSNSGQQVIKGVIYSDASGKPETLLGVTEQLTFSSTNSPNWYALQFPSPLHLSAGSYWIGIITGGAERIIGYRYDSVEGSRDYNENSYSSGPTNPFGTPTVDNIQASLYATYTAPPTITGTAQQGQTLTEVHGTWANSPTSYAYQWQQCDNLGNGCLPISGASGQTYVPAAGDVGHTLRVQETATNSSGSSEPATSEATATVLPPAPTVVTQAASAIAATSATLNATVNPNGGNVTTCTFEYGTTTAYGSSAACSSLPGSGASPVAVSAAISGLTPNTTYHLRISATNAGGTSKGADASFKTLSGPTVTTEAASVIAQTTATLNAKVNPNGSNVTACSFEYGTTTSYGSSAPCSSLPGSGSSPVVVSAAISGLTANTTYHFRISATNATGTSKGADASFKTLTG